MGMSIYVPLTTCQTDTVAPNVGQGSGSAKQAISPGIAGQTAPPVAATVPAPQDTILSANNAEEKARRAVDEFIHPPANHRNDQDWLQHLKNSAVCAAEANLTAQRRRILPDITKLQYAMRLVRQAQETYQGRAETSEVIASEKFSELVALEQRLSDRRKDQPLHPLSAKEIKDIIRVIREVRATRDANVTAWGWAVDENSNPASEPYGRADLCEDGKKAADERSMLTTKISNDVVTHLEALIKADLQNRISRL